MAVVTGAGSGIGRATAVAFAEAEVIRTAVRRWGRIDHLANNAGATAVMRLADTDEQTVTNLLTLNVVAPSLLAHTPPCHTCARPPAPSSTSPASTGTGLCRAARTTRPPRPPSNS
ncbi:SDR family NAD(P)-dependent oxidoreductase [Streptomyces sp. NPDC002265]|uniref:SDR family NAD(P)-dependent oxidoreductase n=1 Tax=Streptomyces sp. NPDC002265 TaxID=3154415 RepID=UPI00332C5155